MTILPRARTLAIATDAFGHAPNLGAEVDQEAREVHGRRFGEDVEFARDLEACVRERECRPSRSQASGRSCGPSNDVGPAPSAPGIA